MGDSNIGPGSPIERAYRRERLCESLGMAIARATEEVFISIDSREWIYPLMAALISARCRGVRVEVDYHPRKEYQGSSRRLNVLGKLGCGIEMRGGSEDDGLLGVVVDPLRGKKEVTWLCEEAAECQDGGSLQEARHERTNELLARAKARADVERGRGFQPSLTRVSEAAMSEVLRRIPFYAEGEIQERTVNIFGAAPTQSVVRAFKVRQAETLLEVFEENRFNIFEPVGAVLSDGSLHLLVPPVVEDRASGLFLIEGHSRAYVCLKRGRREVAVLTVKGVTAALPALPCDWKDVEVVDGGERLSESVLRDRREYTLARRVEDWAHWRGPV